MAQSNEVLFKRALSYRDTRHSVVHTICARACARILNEPDRGIPWADATQHRRWTATVEVHSCLCIASPKGALSLCPETGGLELADDGHLAVVD